MTGQEFKKLLRDNRITQTEASKHLEISVRTVDRWYKLDKIKKADEAAIMALVKNGDRIRLA